MASDDGAFESMIDEYLDCTAKKRRFRLQAYAFGNFLEGAEIRDGEPTGWRFVLPVEPDKPPPWGEMRERIREHLSRRDVVVGPDGKLEMLHRTIRAQVTDTDDEERPLLLVDDLEISWDDLGRLLAPHVGWNLRIEVRDVSEE